MTLRTTQRLKSRGPDADGLVMEAHNDTPAPATARASRRDRGNSFPEILMAIVLMGFAFSALIAGIRTMVAASSTSDDQAKVEAVLNSASDRLANWAYKPCPGANGEIYAPIVSAASASVGWENDTVEIVAVEFWDPAQGAPDPNAVDLVDADGGWSSTNTFAGAAAGCNEDINLTTSRTLQKISIRVSSPDGAISRSLDVVKSNIVADPTSTTTTTTTTTP